MTPLKHGHAAGGSSSRAYKCWISMRQRCRNPKSQEYHNYGGRGIRVCDRWSSFVNFYADMGDPPDGTSIDRINNDGGYEPSNCRWATKAQQRANQRGCIYLEFRGRRMLIDECARESGIAAPTIRSRYRAGVRGDALFVAPDPLKTIRGLKGMAARWAAIEGK